MGEAKLRAKAGKTPAVKNRRRFTTISIPLAPAEAQAVEAAAAAENESLTEFILGGACMLVSRDIAVIEKLLAGFSLDGAEVKLLTRLIGIRQAAEVERSELNKIMTGLLKSRLESHRTHAGKL